MYDLRVLITPPPIESQVSAVVSFLLGPERAEQIQIYAGDVVPRKKPDPVSFYRSYTRKKKTPSASWAILGNTLTNIFFLQAIYLLAAETLGVKPSR